MNVSLHNRIPYPYPVISFYNKNLNTAEYYNGKNLSNTFEVLENNVFFRSPILEKEDIVPLTTPNEYLVRIARQADLDTAADSGYGHSSAGSGYWHSSAGSGYSKKGEYYCPEGIPVETALFGTLAACGLAFGILFMAVTMITMPPMKRRKRGGSSPSDYVENNDYSPISVVISDLLWEGM